MINTFEVELEIDLGALGMRPVSVIGKVSARDTGGPGPSEYLDVKVLSVWSDLFAHDLSKEIGKATLVDIEEALERAYRKQEHNAQFEPVYDWDEVGS